LSSRRDLLLHLPLQVLTVMLSAAKDPEEFNSPQPYEPFKPTSSRLCGLQHNRRAAAITFTAAASASSVTEPAKSAQGFLYQRRFKEKFPSPADFWPEVKGRIM
jgi:hypothetical protein